MMHTIMQKVQYLLTSPTLLNAKKTVPAITSISPRIGLEPPENTMVVVAILTMNCGYTS